MSRVTSAAASFFAFREYGLAERATFQFAIVLFDLSAPPMRSLLGGAFPQRPRQQDTADERDRLPPRS
jgi:hypothetical protein